MRNLGLYFLVLLGLSMVLSISSSSAASTKEHKKKLFEKLRAALNASEVEAGEGGISVPSAEELEKVVEGDGKDAGAVAVAHSDSDHGHTIALTVIQDEEVPAAAAAAAAAETNNKVDTDATTDLVVQSTQNYLAKFRTVFKRVLEMLGLRRAKSKEGRKTRMLEHLGNDVDHDHPSTAVYREEVRATVGAVLGQKECIQKVACVSGSYLKGVKGKQLIFALLESFSPTTWKESVRIAKQSAIFNENCNYKCLEE